MIESRRIKAVQSGDTMLYKEHSERSVYFTGQQDQWTMRLDGDQSSLWFHFQFVLFRLCQKTELKTQWKKIKKAA
jgi:hypothetical protein